MGYNTPILVLNDRLDEIRREPERFVESIANAIASGEREGHAVGQTLVLRTQHADVPRLLFAGGNTMHELSAYASYETGRARQQKYYRDLLRSDIGRARTELRDLERALDTMDIEDEDRAKL